jgi:hypothetical protein
MNANRLINMLINRFSTQAIDLVARKGRDPSTMTPAEREQVRAAQKQVKGARKAMRLTRRFGRF